MVAVVVVVVVLQTVFQRMFQDVSLLGVVLELVGVEGVVEVGLGVVRQRVVRRVVRTFLVSIHRNG